MFYFISCLGHGDPQVNRTVAKTTVFAFIFFICFTSVWRSIHLGLLSLSFLSESPRTLRTEHIFLNFIKNSFNKGWRDDPAVKSTSKGHRFHSQHPHDCWEFQSQGTNTLFWSPRAPDMHMEFRHICRQNNHIHKKILLK